MGNESIKDSSDVSTHAGKKSTSDLVKGNPDETLISNISNADRKLGEKNPHGTMFHHR